MTGSDLLSLDRVELERRRALSRFRNTREFERKKLLTRLLRAEQRAVQLRQWISGIASSEEIPEHSDLGRLLTWARAELMNLETASILQALLMRCDRRIFSRSTMSFMILWVIRRRNDPGDAR